MWSDPSSYRCGQIRRRGTDSPDRRRCCTVASSTSAMRGRDDSASADDDGAGEASMSPSNSHPLRFAGFSVLSAFPDRGKGDPLSHGRLERRETVDDFHRLHADCHDPPDQVLLRAGGCPAHRPARSHFGGECPAGAVPELRNRDGFRDGSGACHRLRPSKPFRPTSHPILRTPRQTGASAGTEIQAAQPRSSAKGLFTLESHPASPLAENTVKTERAHSTSHHRNGPFQVRD